MLGGRCGLETYGNLNMVDVVEIPGTFSRLKDFQGCCEVPVLPMPTALWSLASTTRRLATSSGDAPLTKIGVVSSKIYTFKGNIVVRKHYIIQIL